MTRARLLLDPPLAAAENMGRDEALLKTRRIPTLRFYRWARPTLSLGWFQEAAGLPCDAVRDRGGEAVRRPTGGKAILHGNELTYSLCAPEIGALGGGPGPVMELIHRAFAAELESQFGTPLQIRGKDPLDSDIEGSPWCFEDSSALDLARDGRKLLGSAARRRRGWVLFHGSLVVQPSPETPGTAFLGSEPDLEALARALGEAAGLEFGRGEWEESELARAAILADPYRDPAHLLRR